MKLFLPVILFLLLLSCSDNKTESTSNSDELIVVKIDTNESAKIDDKKTEITDSISYSVITLDDKNYWDSIAYSGSLKIKEIDKSPNNLSIIDIIIPSRIEDLINQQLDNSIDKLHDVYKQEGMTNETTSNKVMRKTLTDNSGLTLIYDKYSLNFEYSEIVILTIWKTNQFVYTYSEQTKLGVNMDVSGVVCDQNGAFVYGHLKSNPEISYGGDFIIKFENGFRQIGYSYFEETN